MDDWDLIEHAKAGDMDAFGEFYRRYYRPVLALLLSRMRGLGKPTVALAEDLAQETFFRLLRRIDSFSDIGKDPIAMLTRIACRLYADHRKAMRSRMETGRPVSNVGGHLDEEYVLTRLGRFVHHDGLMPSVEEDYLSHEMASEVESGLARLNPRQRQCIRLRFYEDRSIEDTAVQLGSNENAVRGLQHRATRKLAKLMKAA